MIQATVSGEKKPVQAFEVRVGGVETPVKIAQVRVGGVAKTFWQEMTATAAPSSVSGAANSPSPISVVTSSSTATPTGGAAPYTYLWSGGGAGWSIDSPASATTSFTRSGLSPNESDFANFICTVTDAGGIAAPTNSIEAFAQNVNDL